MNETPCIICGTCGPLGSREMADGPDGLCSTCRKNSDECHMCKGTGVDADGENCWTCGASGRLEAVR